VCERVFRLVEAGVEAVQLRDHGVAPEGFARAALPFSATLRALNPAMVLTVNTHAAVARLLGAGLHVGRRGPGVAAARRGAGNAPLGVSVHTVEEAREAAEAGADFVFLSPIFPTASHPGTPGLRTEPIRRAAEAAGPVPVFALGGVTPKRAGACRRAGAHGAAVLSGLLDAPDPLAALRAYQAAL